MSSKKEKSAIVRGAGLLTSIFTGLQKEVEKRGGDEEDIHRLTTPEGEELLGKIADLIIEAGRKGKDVFPVVVDYSQSLENMIKAGNYDWVNSDITSDHFPIKGSGKKEVEIALFHFNQSISSDNAIAEMKKAGYRPALIEELLALGTNHKELQKQFPIVALGSVWRDLDNIRDVPSLRWDGSERSLRLYWFGHDWHEGYRFAAVRNAS